ncbi:MAG TPA: Uma2 family endonuclease [Thermoanaerobaculia bacterium]|jgi:hypothetical protein|nr:Uma2 family endonuclease [Thermoanaerobaculia bacterium]
MHDRSFRRQHNVRQEIFIETFRDVQTSGSTGTPEIVVEVVSPSSRDERRDRIEKMGEYAAFGVAWYWIVDPGLLALEILELTSGRYARAARATEGRLETVPGCPGLQLDLDEIWSEIARLEASQGNPETNLRWDASLDVLIEEVRAMAMTIPPPRVHVWEALAQQPISTEPRPLLKDDIRRRTRDLRRDRPEIAGSSRGGDLQRAR